MNSIRNAAASPVRPVAGPAKAAHVRLEGINKIFTRAQGGGDVHALGPVDLDLRRGEFFAVVGPSGCGKSTLLEVIAGLTQASSGTVTFEGRTVSGAVP